eukprot:4444912-Pyramimonas_sp.AAC.1
MGFSYLLSEGKDGIIEPYYISHAEELSTGKQWRNPEYLGNRLARVSTAIMAAPNRWTNAGSASVKHNWSLDREVNDPHT